MMTIETSTSDIERQLQDYVNRHQDFALLDLDRIPASIRTAIQGFLPNYHALVAAASLEVADGHAIVRGRTTLPAIANVQFDLAADFALAGDTPQLAVTLAAVASAAQPIDLKQTLAYLARGAGDALPQIGISHLSVTVDTAKRGCAVEAGVVGNWSIDLGSVPLALTGLSLAISRTSAGMTATLGGTTSVAGKAIDIVANYPDESNSWSFAGGLADGEALGLNALLGQVLPAGVALPDELPEVELSDLRLTVEPKSRAFTVTAKSEQTSAIALGQVTLSSSTVELSLSGKAGKIENGQRRPGEFHGTIGIGGTGPFEIVEGCQLDSFALAFNLEDKQSWDLSGTVQATLCDASFELLAQLKQAAAQRTIRLATKRDSTKSLATFGESGQLSAKNLAIEIVRQRLAAPGTPTTSWSIEAAGKIEISDRLRSDGKIRLFHDAEASRSGLVFESEDTSIEFKLPAIARKEPKVNLQIARIEIIRKHIGAPDTGAEGQPDGAAEPTLAGAPAARSRWEFDVQGAAKIRNLPRSAQAHIPDQIDATLRASSDGVQLTISRLVAPFDLPLRAKIADQNIDLGQALLDASNFTVRLGSVNQVSCDVGVGLPSELNKMFGENQDGSAAVEVFNTYRRESGGAIDQDSIVRLRVGLNTSGVSVQIVTSPLAAITLRTDDAGKTWCDAKLGQEDGSGKPEFGALTFELPIFMYDGVHFTAEGAFMHQDLKLPLTMLKSFLHACGLDALNDRVPRGLPLKGVHVYDAATGLDVDQFVEELEQISGDNLPAVIDDALHGLAGLFEDAQALAAKLPARFTDYLNFDIPESIRFDIAIGVDGSVRGSIDLAEQPLRMLYPGLLMITGVELKRLALGEIMGGALLRLDLDAHVDQFDLPSLVAALALPADQDVLPQPSAWSRRFVADKLFALVFPETVVPVAVPIFFDQLAIEYLGLEGVMFQSHFSFPQPQADFGEIIKLFGDLGKFFSDPAYRLPSSGRTRNLDLKLTVGPNYLQLPKYLTGGQEAVLGPKAGLAPVSAYDAFAHLLNGMKFLSTYELLQLIPFELRHGSQHISLACLSITANWTLTNPKEFAEHSQELFGIAADAAGTALELLPARPARDDTGLLVFAQGGWDVANVASFDARFGLALEGARFATAMQLAGRLSDIVAIDLRGKILADPQSSAHFSLDGTSRLRVLGDDMFNGSLQVRDNRFAIDGMIDLFPGISKDIVDVGGQLHGHLSDTDFDLAGDMHVILGGYALLAGHGRIDQTGAAMIVQWLNQTATFSALKIDGGIALQATLSQINVAGGAFRLSGPGGSGGPTAYLRVRDGSPALYAGGEIGLLGIVSAGGEVRFDGAGFTIDVEGQVFGLVGAKLHAHGGDLLNGGEFSITATLYADFVQSLESELRSQFAGLIADALGLLPDAQELVAAAHQAVQEITHAIGAAERAVQQAFDQIASAAQQGLELADQRLRGLQAEIADAQRAANEALSHANVGVQGKISADNQRIDTLNKDIRNNPLDLIGNAKRSAEIINIGFELGGLEIAKGVVEGVTEAVGQTLDKTLEWVGDLRAQLPAAEQDLARARQTVNQLPSLETMLQQDTTLQGLLRDLDGKLGQLAAAQQNQALLNQFLEPARFMLGSGLDALVSVKSASFSGTLSTVKGGRVALEVVVSLINRPAQTYTLLDITLESPAQIVEKLVDQALPKLPALARIG